VVAETYATHVGLAAALHDRQVRREYVALVWGRMRGETGSIEGAIGRSPADRKRMAVVEGGRRAVTRARVRERWLRADLLDVALQTGRTHQIRVHLAHIGHPVVGDGIYGAGWARGMGGGDPGWARELDRRTPRQFLHAAELMFDHPITGERMRFASPLPEDLARVAAWAASGPNRP